MDERDVSDMVDIIDDDIEFMIELSNESDWPELSQKIAHVLVKERGFAFCHNTFSL